MRQSPGRLDAVDARHVQVHHDDVGSESAHGVERFLAACGLADDLDAGQRAERVDESLAEDRVLVDDAVIS